jgi:pimeloyl-ACP methyl ester carboxylesterase
VLAHARAGTEAKPLLLRTSIAQPALFAFEYALCGLWRAWGVEPSAVLGHSVGEYAAACAAGVFELEDALVLIAERGRLMESSHQEGAMVAVFADEALVAQALEPHGEQVAIAAINAPGNGDLGTRGGGEPGGRHAAPRRASPQPLKSHTPSLAAARRCARPVRGGSRRIACSPARLGFISI